ncbi:MAG TPA: NAD(P)H-hydrate dehydratase [Gammaproteobacteria bacterium]
MSFPHALYRAADVRELDRRAIGNGIPANELMRRAGVALFDALRERFPAAGRMLVLCGGGNNGGDGYVLARLARDFGLDVTLCALTDPAALKGAAREAHAAWIGAGGACTAFTADALRDTDVVIDALLGTGLDRAVEGDMAAVIRAVNAAVKPVIAADIPSGLHADTGAVPGLAIRATLTVSFIGLKAGLFTGRGPAFAGEVRFAGLDVPADVYRDVPPLAERLDAGLLQGWLPPRERDAHKGSFGHVVILGGGAGMPGAARMAGEAALRAGAGKASVLAWPGNVAAIAGGRPELMCRGVDSGEDCESTLRRASVLAAGPGLGQDAWSENLWNHLRHRDNANLPRVIDADGLNWLARHPLPLTANDVITPHPGEAARLLDCPVNRVEANRFAAARRLAEKFGCVAVLKGAGTLIAAPDGRLRVCDAGNPGMASGGMGDVLTGVIAALRAQGLAAFDAACAGVQVHAIAGDRAARRGERGLLASEVLAEIRGVVNPGARGA